MSIPRSTSIRFGQLVFRDDSLTSLNSPFAAQKQGRDISTADLFRETPEYPGLQRQIDALDAQGIDVIIFENTRHSPGNDYPSIDCEVRKGGKTYTAGQTLPPVSYVAQPRNGFYPDYRLVGTPNQTTVAKAVDRALEVANQVKSAPEGHFQNL